MGQSKKTDTFCTILSSVATFCLFITAKSRLKRQCLNKKLNVYVSKRTDNIHYTWHDTIWYSRHSTTRVANDIAWRCYDVARLCQTLLDMSGSTNAAVEILRALSPYYMLDQIGQLHSPIHVVRYIPPSVSLALWISHTCQRNVIQVVAYGTA